MPRFLFLLASVATFAAAIELGWTEETRLSKEETPNAKRLPPRPVTPKAPEHQVYTPSRTASSSSKSSHFPWKRQIPATVFWIGERPTAGNPTPNHASSWDPSWQINYGGYDDPDHANRTHGFRPKSFVPMQNPFYVALPYNDVESFSQTKVEARRVIPWFRERFKKEGRTVCKGQWLVIRHKNRFCFAQWEDCGPFDTDDWHYVFGQSRPQNLSNGGAGIDLSPAVRDYLNLKSGAKVDWRFVGPHEIRNGPWKYFGANNQFAKTNDPPKAKIEELFEQRQKWLRNGGG